MQSSSGRAQSGQGPFLKYERIVNELKKDVDDLWIEQEQNLGSVENEWCNMQPTTNEVCTTSILPIAANGLTVAQMRSQHLHEVSAFYFHSAHTFKMAVLNLAVDGAKVIFFGPSHEVNECNLGCIAFCSVHALSEKHFSN